MCFGDRHLKLGQRERSVLLGARPRPGDLDQVDAALHLVADLLHDVVVRTHELAEGGRQIGELRRQRVADAELGRDLATCGSEPRADDQPGLDGVAHGDGDPLRTTRIAGTRDTGIDHALGADRRPDRPVGDGRVDRELLVAGGLTEADVHVGVDQPWHQGRAGGIDRRHLARVLGGQRRRRPDPGDPVAVGDEHTVVDHGQVVARQHPGVLDPQHCLAGGHDWRSATTGK